MASFGGEESFGADLEPFSARTRTTILRLAAMSDLAASAHRGGPSEFPDLRATAVRSPSVPSRACGRAAREGVAINIIQRQLGRTDLGTTSTYLQEIDPSEIIDAVRSRRQPRPSPLPPS